MAKTIKINIFDDMREALRDKYDKNGKKPFKTETLCVQTVEEIANKN
jgi:hypothetical protein